MPSFPCMFCYTTEYITLGKKDGDTLVSCSICGLIFVNPMPDIKEYMTRYGIKYWYEGQYMKNLPDILSRFEHDYNIAESRLAKIKKYKPSGRLLDVGCSNGAFVKRANEYGYEAEGVEVSSDVIELVQRVNPVKIHCGEVSALNLPPKSFDVITLHDVMEHYYYPRQEIFLLRDLMKPGGILVIDVPDMDHLDFTREQLAWKHIKPKEHLWYFFQRHFDKLAEETKLEIKEVDFPIPGKRVLYLTKNGSA